MAQQSRDRCCEDQAIISRPHPQLTRSHHGLQGLAIAANHFIPHMSSATRKKFRLNHHCCSEGFQLGRTFGVW
jgi:hypothetical protein